MIGGVKKQGLGDFVPVGTQVCHKIKHNENTVWENANSFRSCFLAWKGFGLATTKARPISPSPVARMTR